MLIKIRQIFNSCISTLNRIKSQVTNLNPQTWLKQTMCKQTMLFTLALLVFLFAQSCTHLQPDQAEKGKQAAHVTAAKTQNVQDRAAVTPSNSSLLQSGLAPQNSIGSLPGKDNSSLNNILNLSTEKYQEPLEAEVKEEPAASINATVKDLTIAEKEALESEPEIDFDLDVHECETMQRYFHFYTREKRETFQRWLKRAESYLPYIRKIFTQKGLPQDLVFLPFAESGFNPRAYSRAGAAGLWQFMPATGRLYDLRVDWWIDERRNPYKSTHSATKYLSKLYNQFDDWYLALAAYNAGEGRVARGLRKSGTDNFYDLADTRYYLHRETRNYVPKFQAILKIVRNLKSLGFEPINWEADPEPAKIEVKGGTDLLALAKACNMSWDEFRRLNPAFRRLVSPPGVDVSVYLPEAKHAQAKKYLAKPGSRPYEGFHRYQVRKGDSWWKISRRYGVPISVLKKMNKSRSNIIRPGQWVMVPGKKAASAASTGTYALSSEGTYSVRRGDTLWDISRNFGVSVAKLKQANNLAHAKSLRQGQKLSIPGKSDKAKTHSIAQRRANYTIQKGDTLWDLSRKFGVSLSTLIQANGLYSGKKLQIGQKLYIPDRSAQESKIAKQKAEKAHSKLVKYRVRSGDNLWSIAHKFGVSTKQLQAWNDLPNGLIHPGDRIKVYVR